MAAAAEVVRAARLFGRISSASVSLTDGWFLQDGSVLLQRAVADLDEDRKRLLQYRLRPGDVELPMPTELPTSVAAVLPSPSRRLTARIVTLDAKPKAKTCLELWRGGSLLSRVDGSALHEKIVTEGTFGGFRWSPDERQVVYVAEAKVKESPSPFAAAAAGDGTGDSANSDDPPPGQANWYREDWGEKLGGSDRLALFTLRFSEGKVRRLAGVPADITPGQPVFWGNDAVVYTGWPAGLRKLGAIYCMQRPSSLYLCRLPSPELEKEAQPHRKLTPGLQIARSARPAPVPNCGGADGGGGAAGASASDRGPLAFLGSTAGFDTHTNCLELFVLGPEAAATDEPAKPTVLVPVAARPDAELEGFAGICADFALPRECWAARDVYFNTWVGGRATAWRVRADGSARPSRIRPPQDAADAGADASTTLLAASDAGLLLTWSTPCQPSRAFVRSLDSSTETVLPTFGPCLVSAGLEAAAAAAALDAVADVLPEELRKLRWRLQPVPEFNGGGNSILVEPTDVSGRPGLLLILHGGPHAVATTEFQHSVAFLVRSTECAALIVNYRGSAGFGREALESLPGGIGERDVQDCMGALRSALATGAYDEKRVAVLGGSHGGFLTAHLVGQHPDVFAAAAMRNPVTNVASMVTATDIPDWTYVEGLGLGKFDFAALRPIVGGTGGADVAALTKLFQSSPMAHVDRVKAPVLIALGMKDRRVPPSQGMEFYHALRARGVPTRLLCYEKECHPIDGAAADADHWVNVALWLNEHLPPHT